MTGFPMTLTPAKSLDLSMARSCGLAQRLTPAWQHERELMGGLSSPNLQFYIVTKSGLAERRRIGVRSARWQLRLRP